MSRSISQSKRKPVQPMSCTSFWMPMLGLSSQPQTVPVTTKETAIGYRKMVRKTFSPRMR